MKHQMGALPNNTDNHSNGNGCRVLRRLVDLPYPLIATKRALQQNTATIDNHHGNREAHDGAMQYALRRVNNEAGNTRDRPMQEVLSFSLGAYGSAIV